MLRNLVLSFALDTIETVLMWISLYGVCKGKMYDLLVSMRRGVVRAWC